MSDVKRYNNDLRNFCCGHMVSVLDGEFVLATDYDALASRLAAAEQARAGWQQQAIDRTDDWRKCEIERDSLASRLAEAEREKAAAMGLVEGHALTISRLERRVKELGAALLPLGGGTSNADCLRLVEAVRKAMAEPHGDFIDQGLILVRVLAEAGYRIAALSPRHQSAEGAEGEGQ